MNVPVDPSTSRDHGDPEIVRGTTRDEREAPRTEGCTNCTKGSIEPPGAIARHAGPGLPDPDPELFLLAGLSAARGWPAGARVLRAGRSSRRPSPRQGSGSPGRGGEGGPRGQRRCNRTAAGTLFEDELRAALDRIRDTPLLGGIYEVVGGREYRRTLMAEARYHVHYRVVSPDLVRVLGVPTAGHFVWSTISICISFIRPPCTVTFEKAASISRRSAGVS